MLRNGIPRVCLYFYSTERNSELFSLPRNGWNGIPSVCIYFCFTERNSELFSLPRNGLERNSETPPRDCFYFCSTKQNSKHFSLLRNGSERSSESFLFHGTAAIPPEQTNCSVYSVFLGIIFCRKLPTLPPLSLLYLSYSTLRTGKFYHTVYCVLFSVVFVN
jgi:hypothetical protein